MDSAHNKLTEFTLLWTHAQPSVMAFIRSVTPQLADAEDILQETARQISMRFDEYDSSRPFGPWAMGVAKNPHLCGFAAKKQIPINNDGNLHV